MAHPLTIHGRGTPVNPANRFDPVEFHVDGDWLDLPEDERPAPTTQFLHDTSRTIIASNDSPDVGFTHSINPYRGCEHGCIYCYARPGHEYLGFSAGLDFETKIMVKTNAPGLLRKELASPKWVPQTLSMSGVTDCYQPVERRLRITRRCLEVLAEFRHPVAMITKNHLITRDADLLADLAKDNASLVMLSITTLDPEVARVMEPRTSSPRRRLDAIRTLTAAGIPVGVMVAPIIPGLTDHEAPAILNAAAAAGARWAGYTPVRLPWAIAGLFEDWLARHFPDRKDKVLNRIRSLRGGKLNDPNFGTRMQGQGVWADQLKAMFDLAKRKAGLTEKLELSPDHFRAPNAPNPPDGQLPLF